MTTKYRPGGYDSESSDEWDVQFTTETKDDSLEDLPIRIVYGPGHQAGLNKEDFDVELDYETYQWFDSINRIYRQSKSGPLLQQEILKYYYRCPDTLEVALKLFANVPECSNPKNTSLAYLFIKVLTNFAANMPPERLNVTDNLRMVAFNFFHKHTNLFSLVVDIYDLKAANTLFLQRINELLDMGMYKEVCEIVKLLSLQSNFGIHEFLMPLILQDKLSVVENYLAKAPHVTTELVVFLDTWLDHNESFAMIYDHYLGTRPNVVRDINYTKLYRKTFKKLVKRYADMYRVPREQTPHLTEMDSYGMLKKLIEKKYLEERLTDWDEFIIDMVKPNSQALIDQLVNSCTEYGDFKEAAKWVKHFDVDPEKYSSHLKGYMNEPRAHHSVQNKPRDPRKFYSINQEIIRIVDTPGKCMDMLSHLVCFRTISFDVEWKFGQTDVSLIQLASPDLAFLVDVKTLNACTQQKLVVLAWRRLGETIFNCDEIIKLGFSQDGDMAVLKKNLPQLGLTYEKSNAFIDLKKLWVFMRDTCHFRFPYAEKEAQGKEDLQRLVALTMGKPLNKDQQFSNWSKRPLTQEQILYAASDAYCLLDVFNVFNEAAKQRGFDLTANQLCKQLK